MLRALRIQNFALIDTLDLELSDGFTVITGETGSGKSILLGALNLILGERSDFGLIGPKGDKAVVEVDYELNEAQWKPFFLEHDLDFHPLTTIRREILVSGKSRAFVNDTPIALAALRELSGHLVSIHSQYNTLELKQKDYQLLLLDSLAQLRTERSAFAELYHDWKSLLTERDRLKALQDSADKRMDYLDFQLNELRQLQLDTINYAELESEYSLLESAEEIQSALVSIYNTIDVDGSFSDQLFKGTQLLSKFNAQEELAQLSERLKSILVELKDISKDAMHIHDRIDRNPQRLIELEERINRYNHALRKHHVADQVTLREYWNGLEEESKGTNQVNDQLKHITAQVEAKERLLEEKANDLHHKRLSAATELSEELRTILKDLKLPDTQLTFKLTERSVFNETGKSDLTILFSANAGMVPVPVERAASGGELSRLMLALQKMISVKMEHPTVLFDEIDTGVSGEVADKIGRLLKDMGTTMQLMAITHLPQVASKGAQHLKVEKTTTEQTTVTSVRLLNREEREIEVARLMSGEQITEAAIENARQLMA
jgi:DNA repair protein RecN (Recombination protein N)